MYVLVVKLRIFEGHALGLVKYVYLGMVCIVNYVDQLGGSEGT